MSTRRREQVERDEVTQECIIACLSMILVKRNEEESTWTGKKFCIEIIQCFIMSLVMRNDDDYYYY